MRSSGWALLGALPALTYAADILKTSGFSKCLESSELSVDRMDVQYNHDERVVKFDVSGSSMKSQNVSASITVTAYGKEVYKKEFDPCDPLTKVDQLCPGKKGPGRWRGGDG